jgi:hypothetical protein
MSEVHAAPEASAILAWTTTRGVGMSANSMGHPQLIRLADDAN